jgi:hypothetical protein
MPWRITILIHLLEDKKVGNVRVAGIVAVLPYTAGPA